MAKGDPGVDGKLIVLLCNARPIGPNVPHNLRCDGEEVTLMEYVKNMS